MRDADFVRLGSPGARASAFKRTYFLVACILLAKLVYLQVVVGPERAAAAERVRLQTVPVTAIRGAITDVNGVPIATTVIAKNITTDQTKVDDPKATAQAISEIVGVDASVLRKRLTGTKAFNYVVRNLDPDVAKKVMALGLPGIYSESTVKREYPMGTLASNLIGFVGTEGHGLGGIEYSQDKTLAGVDGSTTGEVVNGHMIPASERDRVAAVNGETVRLTIDQDVQALAERALAKQVKKAGASSGEVIVMDPRTGDILAMATYPTFDPNKPFSVSEYARRNLAVSDVFEPGSTSKVMTIAAVLEEGKADPLTQFTVPGKLKRGGTTFRDHDKHGTLQLTLNGVLAKSSNIGTILASERIGQKTFLKYLAKFGMGSKTGSGLPGEEQGIVHKPGDSAWSDTSFPTMSFGQGLSVTALQATSVFATIANDGVRMTPRILADGPASEGVRVVSKTTARTVREMLESVVSKDGTAPNAQIPGYRVAGKTGTAARYSATKGGYSGYVASFIGFAPADDPSLVVAVMINNPRNGHYGSTIAGPVFRTVMMYALEQQKVPPSTAPKPELSVTW